MSSQQMTNDCSEVSHIYSTQDSEATAFRVSQIKRILHADPNCPNLRAPKLAC